MLIDDNWRSPTSSLFSLRFLVTGDRKRGGRALGVQLYIESVSIDIDTTKEHVVSALLV